MSFGPWDRLLQSDPIRSAPIRSALIRPDPTQPNPFRSSLTWSDQTLPDPTRSDRQYPIVGRRVSRREHHLRARRSGSLAADRFCAAAPTLRLCPPPRGRSARERRRMGLSRACARPVLPCCWLRCSSRSRRLRFTPPTWPVGRYLSHRNRTSRATRLSPLCHAAHSVRSHFAPCRGRAGRVAAAWAWGAAVCATVRSRHRIHCPRVARQCRGTRRADRYWRRTECRSIAFHLDRCFLGWILTRHWGP